MFKLKRPQSAPLTELQDILLTPALPTENATLKRIQELAADPTQDRIVGNIVNTLELRHDCSYVNIGKGYTPPLHLAFSRGFLKCAQFLLQNGADPEAEDFAGCSALHIAITTMAVISSASLEQKEQRAFKAITLLLGHKPNITLDQQNNAKQTFLHLLAFYLSDGAIRNHQDLMEIILSHPQLNINLPAYPIPTFASWGKNPFTVLQITEKLNKPFFTHLLLKNCPNILLKNTSLTQLDIAISRNDLASFKKTFAASKKTLVELLTQMLIADSKEILEFYLAEKKVPEYFSIGEKTLTELAKEHQATSCITYLEELASNREKSDNDFSVITPLLTSVINNQNGAAKDYAIVIEDLNSKLRLINKTSIQTFDEFIKQFKDLWMVAATAKKLAIANFILSHLKLHKEISEKNAQLKLQQNTPVTADSSPQTADQGNAVSTTDQTNTPSQSSKTELAPPPSVVAADKNISNSTNNSTSLESENIVNSTTAITKVLLESAPTNTRHTTLAERLSTNTIDKNNPPFVVLPGERLGLSADKFPPVLIEKLKQFQEYNCIPLIVGSAVTTTALFAKKRLKSPLVIRDYDLIIYGDITLEKIQALFPEIKSQIDGIAPNQTLSLQFDNLLVDIVCPQIKNDFSYALEVDRKSRQPSMHCICYAPLTDEVIAKQTDIDDFENGVIDVKQSQQETAAESLENDTSRMWRYLRPIKNYGFILSNNIVSAIKNLSSETINNQFRKKFITQFIKFCEDIGDIKEIINILEQLKLSSKLTIKMDKHFETLKTFIINYKDKSDKNYPNPHLILFRLYLKKTGDNPHINDDYLKNILEKKDYVALTTLLLAGADITVDRINKIQAEDQQTLNLSHRSDTSILVN